MARGNTSASSANYAAYLTAAPLSDNAGPFTVGAWVKQMDSAHTGGSIWRIYHGSNSNRFSMRYEAATTLGVVSVGYTGTDPRTNAAITLPDDNAWHHVCWRYAGAGGSWDKFIGGTKTVINATITFTLPTLNRTELFRQDGTGDSFSWFGDLADAFIFNTTALSDGDIATLAAGTRVATLSPNILYEMDVDEGSSILNSGSTAAYTLTVTGELGFTSDPPYGSASSADSGGGSRGIGRGMNQGLGITREGLLVPEHALNPNKRRIFLGRA